MSARLEELAEQARREAAALGVDAQELYLRRALADQPPQTAAEREQYVLRRVREGAAQAQIAAELGIRANTRGSTSVSRIYQRALRKIEGARIAARRPVPRPRYVHLRTRVVT